MRLTSKALTVAAATSVLSMMGGGVAFADNVQNDVTATPEGKIVTITRGATGVPVGYSIGETGGDSSDERGAQCNAADGSEAVVAPAGVPTGVTLSPSSQSFSNCTDVKSITFTAALIATAGDYAITASVNDAGATDAKDYNTTPASFTLRIVNPSVTAVAPTVTPVVDDAAATAGDNGWYKDGSVGLTWTITGTPTPTLDTTVAGADCGPQTVATDGQHSFTCAVTNSAGQASQTVTIKRDATAPTVTCPSPAPVYLLNANSPAAVSAAVLDTTSLPVSSTATGAPDVSSVGSKTVSVTGTDNAGNSTTVSCGYSVKAVFTAGNSAIDGSGLTKAKAGSAVPLKWRITDANGVGVTGLTTLGASTVPLTCSLLGSADDLAGVASGNSGLQDLGEGYYQWNWKTPTTYSNTCKTLTLNLTGTGLTASSNFQFTK